LLSILQDDIKEAKEVSAIIGKYALTYLCKEPWRISKHTCHSWLQDILQGHPTHWYEMFQMEKDMFNQLYIELVEHDLQGTKQMGVREMVIMFLNMIGHEIGNTMIQKRFQHSKGTVNRHFHKVLVVCLRLAFKYIKPQDSRFYYVNPKIKNESQYWPFFKNVIRAIDDTLPMYG